MVADEGAPLAHGPWLACDHVLRQWASRGRLEDAAPPLLSDHDCELLVRWMWKFEGLQWHLNFAGSSEWIYSQTLTLTERVTTTTPFEQIKAEMALAISRVKSNDEALKTGPSASIRCRRRLTPLP
jgi:hypothetical protein